MVCISHFKKNMLGVREPRRAIILDKYTKAWSDFERLYRNRKTKHDELHNELTRELFLIEQTRMRLDNTTDLELLFEQVGEQDQRVDLIIASITAALKKKTFLTKMAQIGQDAWPDHFEVPEPIAMGDDSIMEPGESWFDSKIQWIHFVLGVITREREIIRYYTTLYNPLLMIHCDDFVELFSRLRELDDHYVALFYMNNHQFAQTKKRQYTSPKRQLGNDSGKLKISTRRKLEPPSESLLVSQAQEFDPDFHEHLPTVQAMPLFNANVSQAQEFDPALHEHLPTVQATPLFYANLTRPPEAFDPAIHFPTAQAFESSDLMPPPKKKAPVIMTKPSSMSYADLVRSKSYADMMSPQGRQ